MCPTYLYAGLNFRSLYSLVLSNLKIRRISQMPESRTIFFSQIHSVSHCHLYLTQVILIKLDSWGCTDLASRQHDVKKQQQSVCKWKQLQTLEVVVTWLSTTFSVSVFVFVRLHEDYSVLKAPTERLHSGRLSNTWSESHVHKIKWI